MSTYATHATKTIQHAEATSQTRNRPDVPLSSRRGRPDHRCLRLCGAAISGPAREKLRVSAFTSADIPKILALDPDLILTSTIAADLISAGVAVHSSIPVPCTEPHFKERSRVKSSTTAQDTKVSAVGHHDPKDVERLLPSPICPSLIPMLAVGISCLGPGCLLLRNSKDEACPFHRPSPQRGRTLCKSGGRSDEMSAGIPMTSKSAPATARSWACWRHRAWARAGY